MEVQVLSRALEPSLEILHFVASVGNRALFQSATTDAGAAKPSFTAKEDTEGLTISGSKTFGVEIGNNRDLKLRQSLDLRLVGNVSSDVSLLAVLSDQDVPAKARDWAGTLNQDRAE